MGQVNKKISNSFERNLFLPGIGNKFAEYGWCSVWQM